MYSPKPYIIRAFYDWVEANHCTPFMAIDATEQGVSVPPSLAHEAQVVFDLSANTAAGLALGDRMIEFKARFSGVLHHVRIPPIAVLGVYAKENGSGVLFLEDGSLSIIGVELDAMVDAAKDMPAMASKPKLKVVTINPKKQVPDCSNDQHADDT
jgi:stringent starvation protein B